MCLPNVCPVSKKQPISWHRSLKVPIGDVELKSGLWMPPGRTDSKAVSVESKFWSWLVVSWAEMWVSLNMALAGTTVLTKKWNLCSETKIKNREEMEHGRNSGPNVPGPNVLRPLEPISFSSWLPSFCQTWTSFIKTSFTCFLRFLNKSFREKTYFWKDLETRRSWYN